MREQTYILLPGAITVGQSAEFAPVSYNRQVERITLVTGTAPATAPLTVGLILDDVVLAEQYSLPIGQKRLAFVIGGGGVGVAAEASLEAVVIASGDALDAQVWIESDVTAQPGDDENWVVLTAGMLQSRIATQEYTLFTGSTLSSGQADPVPQILADMAQLVRASVRSGGKVALGPAGTIPASCKNAALTLAKFEVYARTTSLRQFIETIRPEKVAAEKYLAMIATGEITPEAPTSPTEDEPEPPAGNWGSETRLDL